MCNPGNANPAYGYYQLTKTKHKKKIITLRLNPSASAYVQLTKTKHKKEDTHTQAEPQCICDPAGPGYPGYPQS